MNAKDIKVGDKFLYVNMVFTCIKKLKTGVKFRYNNKIYFRSYRDIKVNR